MLTELRLRNFKAFDDPSKLALTGLNLIYGENSAGKSSVAQAALLLKQSWPMSRLATEQGQLEFRGSYVDLGGFTATISRHDTESGPLGLGFSYRPVGVSLRNTFGRNPVSIDLAFAIESSSRKASLSSVTLEVEGALRCTFSLAKKNGALGLYLADSSSARSILTYWLEFGALKTSNIAGLTKRRREPLQFDDATVAWAQGWLRKTPADVIGFLPAWQPTELRGGRPGRPVGGSLDSPKRQLLQEFVFEWQLWMSGLYTAVAREFNSVKYVGPLRRPPQRLVIEASQGSRELGPRGEQALHLLANNTDLLRDVNKGLRLMEVPYELNIQELSHPADAVDLGDISVLSLRDVRNGTKVTLGDVGVGVSQLLPVLIQLISQSGAVIVIEQPELHLHPRLQSRLADLMIDAVVVRHNHLLVETHSEHILIRIQRRMRESKIHRGRVTVSYVANEIGSSRILNLRQGPNGDLLDGWPTGFFDSKLEDLLAAE